MSDRLKGQPEPERDPVNLPLAGREPVAKRLNRNALTVAAVIMGVTVLTAVVLLNPGRSGAAGAGQSVRPAPPPSVPPAFLNQPLPRPALPQDTATTSNQAQTTSPGARRNHGRGVRPGEFRGAIRGIGASPAPSRRAPSPREQAFRAALVGGVIVGATRRPAGGATADVPWTGAREGLAEHQALRFSDSVLSAALRRTLGTPARRAAAAGSRGTAEPTGVLGPAHGQRASDAFVARARSTGAVSPTMARLVPERSPFTLAAGTLIPGVLITGIASDLPGEIVGQTSRDVYDSRAQRILLIPKGSKLIGTYDNQVVASQSRLLVAWTRLILPDGRSMTLPGLALADAQGRAGAEGKVDNHGRHVFGSALLLSLISAGAQLSQPRQASLLAAPSAGQVAAGAMGQELSQVALEMLRRGMNVPPTITIRAGQPFNVFLNGDIVFDGPYEAIP